jgi:hypothetical protein
MNLEFKNISLYSKDLCWIFKAMKKSLFTRAWNHKLFIFDLNIFRFIKRWTITHF